MLNVKILARFKSTSFYHFTTFTKKTGYGFL